MRVWNQVDAIVYPVGLVRPRNAAVLVVRGRRTGRSRQVPVAVADVDGREYLVSMLGPGAGWVRDVLAADGRAALRRRRREVAVLLEPVSVEDRAPVLRRYVAVAPAARPHLGVGRTATRAELDRIASAHPVFAIRERPTPR